MDGHIVCGGYSTQTSCLYYVAGQWKYRNDLQYQRTSHVSWRRPDGELLMIGGEMSTKSSEVVSSSGYQKGFTAKHVVQ